jgi:hypothetical protein
MRISLEKDVLVSLAGPAWEAGCCFTDSIDLDGTLNFQDLIVSVTSRAIGLGLPFDLKTMPLVADGRFSGPWPRLRASRL